MTENKGYAFYPVILNSENLVNDNPYNNKYRFSFPNTVRLLGSKIAVSNINIYYSWYNISAANNNNQFSIIHPTFAGSTTLSITVPDGFYSVLTLNAYLQQVLIANNFYLVNGDGDYVYYAELVENATYYSVQYNAYEVPTALPVGWSNPGAMTFPVAAARPQLVVASTNDFKDIIGFNAGTYPTLLAGTTYSKLSDYTPQVSPITSMVVSCSLLNNKYTNPSTVLYTFGFGVSYGTVINSSPNEMFFTPVVDGNYNFFEIQFLDQRFNPVYIKDTNLIVTLIMQIPL